MQHALSAPIIMHPHMPSFFCDRGDNRDYMRPSRSTLLSLTCLILAQVSLALYLTHLIKCARLLRFNLALQGNTGDAKPRHKGERLLLRAYEVVWDVSAGVAAPVPRQPGSTRKDFWLPLRPSEGSASLAQDVQNELVGVLILQNQPMHVHKSVVQPDGMVWLQASMLGGSGIAMGATVSRSNEGLPTAYLPSSPSRRPRPAIILAMEVEGTEPQYDTDGDLIPK
jgi:hypothetical protein